MDQRTARFLIRGIAGILLYGIVFEAWLIVQPAGHAAAVAVDDWLDPIGPLLVLVLGFLRAGRGSVRAIMPSARGRRPTRPQRASLALALGVCSYVLGASLWSFYELYLHQPPFPSWADAGYLGAYPFLLAGILLLPGRTFFVLARIRAVLDSLLILIVVLTLSWYFVLGPTLQSGGETPLAKGIGVAYPAFDLILVLCLLLVGFRVQDAALRPIVLLLSGSLAAIVAVDSVFAYSTLHGTYATGELIDPLWPMAYGAIGLCAVVLGLAASGREALTGGATVTGAVEDDVAKRPLWRTLLPYALVPLVVALAVYAWQNKQGQSLAPGVYIGASALVALVLIHQILVLLENDQLHGRLGRVYRDALQESRERYRDLFENANDLVFSLDRQGKFISLNAATERALAYSREEVGNLHIWDVVAPEYHGTVSQHLRQDGAAGRPYELEIVGKHGRRVVLEVSSRHVYQDERVVGTQNIARDITDRKQAEAMLVHQALHDELTDLPNRTLLYDRLHQAILAARRGRTSLSLLFMDLDRFKEINDTFGHHYGDLVLQEVARRIQHALRSSDTATRLGGDEFGVLLTGSDRSGATVTADRITESLARPFMLEGQTFHIGASIGIVLHPDHGDDVPTLMRRADVAMYAAKRLNRDYAVYDPDQDDNSPVRLQLIADLREAIERDGLFLHFQPKVELGSGRVCSVEALVRWQHPRLGTIPPGQFIPLAEYSGLIKPLSLWVLDAALRQSQAWQQMGLTVPVAVNLSAENLREHDLPDTILELLSHRSVHPSMLQVEITESTVMRDRNRATEILSRLRDMGVSISLDDFGTGYSSLAHLKQLPVDEIKIDRSFVAQLAINAHDLSIVRTISELGHSLGLRVVVEGVEDKRTLDLLARAGCDIAQGYFLSPPLSPGDLTGWIAARGAEERQGIAS